MKACAPLLLLALSSGALAQPRVEGSWRLECLDANGQPSGGAVLIEADGAGGFRYERRTRVLLADPVTVERGTARLDQGRLVTEASAPGMGGAVAGGAATLAGRYELRGDAWTGRRDGASADERLVAVAERPTNELELLVDGEGFTALRDDLRSAASSIDVQVFQWADDSTGRPIGEIMMDRARAGARVRCLLDCRSRLINSHLKVEDATKRLTGELEAAGVTVIVQHRLGEHMKNSLAGAGRWFGDALLRVRGRRPPPREKRGLGVHDHRKVFVVDRRVAYLGGQNFSADYELRWHDVQARFEGPAVRAAEAMFQDRWSAAGGQSALAVLPADPGTGDVPIEVVGSIPGLGDPIKERLLAEMRAARHEVLAELAFLLDDDAIDAFMATARRGVRTVLVIPAEEEQPDAVVRDAFLWVQNEVVRSGVELYRLRGRLLHAKVLVFDGRLAAVGSHNLRGSGLAESELFVPDARFARELRSRLWEVDLPGSERMVVRNLTWKEKLRSLWAKFLDAII